MPGKLKLAVLISGSGTNLQALIDACREPDYPAEVAVVLSNKADAYGLERAKAAGIPTEVISHKDFPSREEFDEAVHEAISGYDPGLVCLAGFMRILSRGFVQKWDGRMINTHPALLPRHGGPGMYGDHVHQAVLDAGDEESGPSIHFVIAAVDQGAVILQRRVPILPNDTVDSLSQRVIAEEHIAYVEAVQLIAENRVQITGNRVKIL